MLKLAALFFIPACIWAARPIELNDYYRVETASSPVISPDGRRVAFVRTYIVEADNRSQTELWLSPSDAGAPAIRLTEPALNATSPVWSPDGKLLAFHSGRRGAAAAEGGIWFLRMDQPGAPFQIPGVGGEPAFSPDGQWIAFTRKTPPATKAPEPSPLEHQLQQRFKGHMYDWMGVRFDGRGYLPDPRDPAATPPAELYIVPIAGGTPRQLTHLGVDVRTPVWKPDSRALAFTANSHQRDEYQYERADLWVAALDGNTRRLTDDGFEYDSPEWSPDGRSLLFRRQASLSQIIGQKQPHGAKVDVCRLPAEGGAVKILTAQWDLIPEHPRWGENNEFIYITAAVGGDGQLFRMPVGGSRAESLTHGDRALAAFSFSKNFDRIAYTVADSTHPAEVYAARADGSGEVKLSALNDAWLSTVSLSRSQKFWYPSADGSRIEGWITLPLSGAAPHPLVLSIHGGPHGAFGDTFSFEFQYLAANGYAALSTNPRGSTGYGEKFLWGTWGGWGKLDYQDVMAGVDAALQRYPVDKSRMVVSGYSYGGFLTNWVITQTDRFAAAISGAGVVNWISDYGTSDIPRTKESEFFGSPWQPESAALMRSFSPITFVGNVKTPTLFLNGESDMRVPISEAEQMYTALQKRHVPAKAIRYPGNYHGGWPPWDMVHRLYYELQWCRQWAPAAQPGPAPTAAR